MTALPLPAVGGLGGLLLALGLPPLAFPPLALLGLLAFAWIVHRAGTTPEAALAGGAFAGTASLVALHWVPAAAEPWLGMAGGLSAGISTWMLHASVGGLVVALTVPLRDTLPLPLRAAAAWGVLEWLPGALPIIGLPWFGVAATLTGWPLLLPLVAVAGSGGVGVILTAAMGAGLEAKARPRLAGGVGVVVLAWVGGSLGLEAAAGRGPGDAATPATRLAVLEWERPRGEVADRDALAARIEAMIRVPLPSDGVEGSSLPVLWPEAPFPGVPGELGPEGEGPDLLTRYLARVRQSGDAVAGIQARVGGRVYNTLVRTGRPPEAPEGIHRKRYLVPGVERTTLLDPGGEGRGLAPGAGALPFEWGGIRTGGLICFEILYPAEVARLRRRGGTLLVQATNDAMLQPGGRFPVIRDAARRQHEAMIRLRSAEFRLPAVRAAHGGTSGASGPDGRWLEPVEVVALRGRPGTAGAVGGDAGGDELLGHWKVFDIPSAGPVPPAAWLGPPLGPLALALLLVPLVAIWRRDQVLGR